MLHSCSQKKRLSSFYKYFIKPKMATLKHKKNKITVKLKS